MRFPVFEIAPLTTRAPELTGELNVPVRRGGIIVNPGGIVLADDHGIVVLPPSRVEEIVRVCLPRAKRPRSVRDGVRLGELAARINALPPPTVLVF